MLLLTNLFNEIGQIYLLGVNLLHPVHNSVIHVLRTNGILVNQNIFAYLLYNAHHHTYWVHLVHWYELARPITQLN